MHSVDHHVPAGANEETRPQYLASTEKRRPGRVIFLAAALTIGTTLALGGASEFFDSLGGGRYAEDVIRIALARF